MKTKAAVKPIQLKFEDAGRRVVVTPDDNDRYLLTVEQAILACNLMERVSGFQPRFEKMLSRLAAWLSDSRGAVDSAYVTIRDAGLLFLVVRKNTEYDREFEDALTELDLAVARDRDTSGITISMLALPKCSNASISGFLHPDYSLQYDAS